MFSASGLTQNEKRMIKSPKVLLIKREKKTEREIKKIKEQKNAQGHNRRVLSCQSLGGGGGLTC